MCDANKTQTIDPRLTGVELVCVTLTKHTIDPRLTGVELVCVTLTKHKLSIPVNYRSGTGLCDANKAQTIDPHLTKHKQLNDSNQQISSVGTTSVTNKTKWVNKVHTCTV